jgi:hypothetical protein
VRRGEKVPATVGTVADGLVQRQVESACHGEGAWFVGDRTGSLAVGTGRLVREGLAILLQEDGESALGETCGSGGGDVLEVGEVELGVGRVASVAGDNFSPLGGQFTDLLELFLRDFALHHGLSRLRLRNSNSNGLLFSL